MVSSCRGHHGNRRARAAVPETPPGYQVTWKITPPTAAIQHERGRRSTFILITDEPTFTAFRALQAYKRQNQDEHGFRWMKEPIQLGGLFCRKARTGLWPWVLVVSVATLALRAGAGAAGAEGPTPLGDPASTRGTAVGCRHSRCVTQLVDPAQAGRGRRLVSMGPCSRLCPSDS